VHYIQLAKPRSVLLLLMTALAGMIMAQPELPPPHLLAMTLLGGALAAAGANALNCYLDRDIDILMSRTAGRPLPTGDLLPERALAAGLLMCFLAVAILASTVNWISALLALTGILYYVLIYTMWLKRASRWNVAIGGGAGALPILVGWSAVTGQLAIWPLWLGAIVVCWTMPHFWALALLRRHEYAMASIPMLPVVAGEGATRHQIVYASLAVVALTLLLVPAGFAGIAFLLAALVLGAILVFMALRLLYSATDEAAWQLYRYSIFYLTLIFAIMIVDRISWLMPLGGAG
jgi:heme o synthase